MSKSCKCTFCINYDKYRWAVITTCPCGCHTSDSISGHDSLCCEFANGKVKDNPYKENLEKPEVYNDIINKYLYE